MGTRALPRSRALGSNSQEVGPETAVGWKDGSGQLLGRPCLPRLLLLKPKPSLSTYSHGLSSSTNTQLCTLPVEANPEQGAPCWPHTALPCILLPGPGARLTSVLSAAWGWEGGPTLVSPAWLSLGVCTVPGSQVPWAGTGLVAETPLCSRPIGRTVAHIPAPGPRVADGLPARRRCGGRRQRAPWRPHGWKTHLVSAVCVPASTHSAGSRETTSISAWRGENSLPDEGPFQSTQGLAGGQGQRAAETYAASGVTEGGSEAGTGFCSAAWSWLPWAPRQGTGRQDCRARGPPSPAPAACLCSRHWLPEKGGPFWKNEQITNSFNNFIL